MFTVFIRTANELMFWNPCFAIHVGAIIFSTNDRKIKFEFQRFDFKTNVFHSLIRKSAKLIALIQF